MKFLGYKKIFFAFVFLFLAAAPNVRAAYVGDILNFYVDPGFDALAKSQATAALIKIENDLYFYVEKSWWNSQSFQKQAEISNNLSLLSQEFNNRIYPNLTAAFGQEQKPGIDEENRITVLFHPMADDYGGYFRTADEYPKIQVPNSNEREMLYLPTQKLNDLYQLKVLLAHELVHLITFNQKDRAFNLTEDTWLNEARADYSATLLGYNDNYVGSILEQRMRNFLENPTDSLVEWKETKSDYAVASLFIHYLADHYGSSILSDSLKLNAAGIESLNQALRNKGAQENFGQIFANWTVAVAINDCSLGKHYCYLRPRLQTIRLTPSLNFLPISGSSSLSVTNAVKNWAGGWQKVFGGNGNLTLNFVSQSSLNFKVPYIIQDKAGNISVNFLALDKNQTGQAHVPDFGVKNTSIIIMPSLQAKTSGFTGNETSFPYTFTVSVGPQTTPPVNGSIITPSEPLNPELPAIPAGFSFNKNFNYGAISQDVVYMKVILAREGCLPSRLVDINEYGSATLAALKCFKHKYDAEISKTAGYQIIFSDYVGPGTRKKLNDLLGNLTQN